MSQYHRQILEAMNPGDPATIQKLIDHHRQFFGGARMADDPPTGKTGDDGGKPPEPSGEKPDSKPDEKLGEPGLKALQAERDARQALEQQLKKIQDDSKAQMDKLAEAFGLKKDDKSGQPDVVAQLQQQMATMQHDNLVLKVAAENKISDADDVALLRATQSEEAMRKLATRLAGKPDDGQGSGKGGKRPPNPDQSQGHGNGRTTGSAGVAEAEKRFGKKQ